MRTLFVRVGGRYREARDAEVLEVAAHVQAHEAEEQRITFTIDSPEVSRAFVKGQLAHLDHERFVALMLDARHRLIAYRVLSIGTIDGATVHPREVVKEALSFNAAAVIFAHNHPSGVAEPSVADELITRRLRDALTLVDIRVLDHLIVGMERVMSFAERGLL